MKYCNILREDFFTIINLLGNKSFPISQVGSLWIDVWFTDEQIDKLKENKIHFSLNGG